MFIKPLQLGSLQLPNNLIQGPLAGYSCAPFRVITQKYGNPAFCVTEMISAKDLIHRHPKPKRYLGKDPQEGLLCYQLSGNDPEFLGKAAALVSEHGADLIDLNCGCPVSKIRAKQAGSKLLTTPETIHALVKAIKANTNATVSIKIRIAGSLADHNDANVIDAAEQAGVDFITVHGRHWTERYDVPCQYDAIADIVRYARVPIIANGDVQDYPSLKRIFEITQCAGVMIARASVGKPWLFQKLVAEENNLPFSNPNATQIGEIFREHLRGLIALEKERFAVLQARKFAKYYGHSLANPLEFTIAMQKANTEKDFLGLIEQFFYN